VKFIAERSAILSALSFVEKYAETNKNIPILTHVKLLADDKGVSLVSTDLDLAARDRFAAHVERQGSVCLPARILLDAIKGSPTATEVLIDDDGKSATVLVGSKSRFKLLSLPATDFPEPRSLEIDTSCSFKLDAAILPRIAKEVAFACDVPPAKYPSCVGVSWQARNGHIEFAATDTAKLSMLRVLCAGADSMPDIVVPPITLPPSWTGEVGVGITENFIRFSCGNQVVATSLIDAKYLDYRRIIPTHEKRQLFDRAELVAAIGRVCLIGDSGKPSILLVGRDGKCSISTIYAQGEAHDDVAFDGDDFVAAFAHRVLAPCLASLTGETVEFQYHDHAAIMVIADPKDEARLLLAFPWRDARVSQYVDEPQLQAAE
jgi:DNA polymerase-3 subunit beta